MLCAPCRSKSSGCRAIAPIPQFDLLLLPLSAELFRGWQRSRGGRLAAPRRPAAAAQQGGGAAGLWRGAQTVQKAREVRCKKDPCISTHCELGCIRANSDASELSRLREACRALKRLACLLARRRLLARAAAGTRAHACRTRSTRTHHACAPRQRRTCSHIATRAHVKKTFFRVEA